tara:strand:- start:2536 stop:2928 length:393 start_codon:yes stop_codon:yes gene_type:complete
MRLNRKFNQVSSFSKNVAPYVTEEIQRAFQARKSGSIELEFSHLENAHIIGQESTFWHVKVHMLMLLWAARNCRATEFIGQVVRIIGAATKTKLGLVPKGNTGGSNVSPFKVMPIKTEHQTIINRAKVNA